MATVDVLQVAEILREVAETEILPRWRNLAAHEVTRKTGEGAGLVTIADHAAELALAARLAALLPGSIVVGEEAVAADPAVLQRFRSDEAIWVVDPIDGTRRFAEGSTVFDVMVALVVGGKPVAGWILAPAEDTLYLGEPGNGAEMRSPQGHKPLHACHDLSLAAMEGILGANAFLSRGLPDPSRARHAFAAFVKHQCAGHNYGRLFQGHSHFLINFSTYPWDHLPGLAIATAAGFHAARHDGRPFDPLDRHGGILVAPDAESWDKIHKALLAGNEPA
ncbi:MAG: inositol monophosphatase family protein [Hyphomicrobiaceae bacterium]